MCLNSGDDMTEKRCPHCGQVMPSAPVPIQTAEALVAAMRVPPPPSGDKIFRREERRDVYEGYERGNVPTGRFYVTFAGGEASREAVGEALARGLIRLKYDFDGCWCLSDG
jgi:hypothetical protein